MRTPIAFALLAILAFAVSPTTAADRACRPSLSNLYKCPDTSPSVTKSTKTAAPEGRTCKPSLSNLWTCPGNSQSRRKSVSIGGRPCRPSLSNGYSCPGTSGSSAKPDSGAWAPPKKSASLPDRACRPSLSNGYKCPGTSASQGPAAAYQYSTEAQARAHCPGDTVVWVNTASNIYHFHGTWNYGNTKAGAYMCEEDSLSEGMRAAKNETHP
jgi:hypothetical protein